MDDVYAVTLWATALWGCAGSEPVVPAVQPTETVEQVAERRKRQELRASPRNVEVLYEKPEGVYVDVRYLGGRSWDGVREDVERQLGAVLGRAPTPEGDEEVTLQRGTVRLRDGAIVMIDVPLPEPARRTDALVALGFPANADGWQALALEYRLVNAWGFRRLRFVRADRESEDIVRVQAWKTAPSDR